MRKITELKSGSSMVSFITYHVGGIVIETENFYYPSDPRKSLSND